MRMTSILGQEVLTMRTSTPHQPMLHRHAVKTEGRRIKLRAERELELPLPAPNEQLPATLEHAVDDTGQRLKRLLFQHAREQADQQLILRHYQGKRAGKFRRRGRATTTFKTVFGTVKV